MRTDAFWALIDDARTGADGDTGAVVTRATALLAAREPDEIVGFHRHLSRVLAASYQVDLWAAAYLINGGCSDDGFEHFRGWLLLQGRATFARAVREPDALAELPAIRAAAVTGAEFAAEEALRLAEDAYRRATASGLPPVDLVSPPALGEFWDFDDEERLRVRLPRLAALFLEPPQE